MQTRLLGQTDVRVTEIALGTWGLAQESYGRVDAARFEATVQSALDSNVRTFDLAPTWGKDGASERIVGRVTKSLRDECTFITRAGVERDVMGVRIRFDEASIVRDCEASLMRLGTDRLDVLLLHHPDAETLRRLDLGRVGEQLRLDGKIRAWGVTGSSPLELRAAIDAGAQVVCLPYNLLKSELLDDLLSRIVIARTGVLARSPLAYGLLAGAFGPEQHFAESDHRSRRWDEATLARRLAAVAELGFLVHDDVHTPTDAALRWVLANNLVSSCLVGARSPAQASSAAAASTGAPYLPDEDLTRVPQVLAALGL